MSAGAQDRITKLEALLERVRARGTRDDAAPSVALAAKAAAAPAAAAAQVVTPIPIPTPIPARPAADVAPISGIPEVTVGREGAREFVREVREDGRRISNVPASVRGSTDQELPSVIIAPAPLSAPISVPPISSVELEADDVIEAEPAPARSLTRPPPPPPARSPTIPPPSTVVTPIPVASAPPPPAAPAPVSPEPVQLSVPTPAPTPIPTTRQPQPHYVPQPRQSENRLGDADITAGHPVSVDVDLDDEVATREPEEQPAPSSSRRPRSEHAELGAALEEDEASPPPHTVPPESGRQASVAPAESGKRSSAPAVAPDSAPPPSLRPDVATGRQPEAQVASFAGEPAVKKPSTFGELLDNALSL